MLVARNKNNPSRRISTGHCPSPGHRRLLYTPCICVLNYILVQSTISRLLRKLTGRPSSLPTTAVAYAWLSSLPAFFFFLGARRGCAIRFLSSSSCSDLEDETLSLYSQSEPRHETGWRDLRSVPCGGGGQEKRPSGEKRDCNHVSFGQKSKGETHW